MESYIRAVLRADPTFFENQSNLVEFRRVTGGDMPDIGTIERLTRETQMVHE